MVFRGSAGERPAPKAGQHAFASPKKCSEPWNRANRGRRCVCVCVGCCHFTWARFSSQGILGSQPECSCPFEFLTDLSMLLANNIAVLLANGGVAGCFRVPEGFCVDCCHFTLARFSSLGFLQASHLWKPTRGVKSADSFS